MAVAPSLWLSVLPTRSLAAAVEASAQAAASGAPSWILGRVVGTPADDESLPAGWARVEIPHDAPTSEAAGMTDGGVSALGAIVMVTLDPTGKVVSISSPIVMPEGATPVAMGALGERVESAMADAARAFAQAEEVRARAEAAQAAAERNAAELTAAKRTAEEAAAKVGTLAGTVEGLSRALDEAKRAAQEATSAASSVSAAAAEAIAAAQEATAAAASKAAAAEKATKEYADAKAAAAQAAAVAAASGDAKAKADAAQAAAVAQAKKDAKAAADAAQAAAEAKAQAAQSAAEAASNLAKAAEAKAAEAKAAADAASSKADTASSAAGKAQAAADAGRAAATAAESKAATAQAAAQAAQAAADAAALKAGGDLLAGTWVDAWYADRDGDGITRDLAADTATWNGGETAASRNRVWLRYALGPRLVAGRTYRLTVTATGSASGDGKVNRGTYYGKGGTWSRSYWLPGSKMTVPAGQTITETLDIPWNPQTGEDTCAPALYMEGPAGLVISAVSMTDVTDVVAAQVDAVEKAKAAETAAKTYADAQAKARADAALAEAKGDAASKAQAAQSAAIAAAAKDAADKAKAAQTAAEAKAATAQATADKAATAAATAQAKADEAAAKAVEAKNAANAANAKALGAQAVADKAQGAATTADKRYTTAPRSPHASDGDGRPDGAVWEDRTNPAATRRWVWSTSSKTWTVLKAGQDFIGDKAIGRAQIGDLAVGTAQVADAAITNAQIGDLAVDKLTVTGGARIPTAVMNSLVAEEIFTTAALAQSLTVTGGPNLIPDGMGEAGGIGWPTTNGVWDTTERAFKTSKAGGFRINPANPIPVVAGDEYVVRVEVKGPSGATAKFNADGTIGKGGLDWPAGSNASSVTCTGAWQTVESAVTIKAGVTQLASFWFSPSAAGVLVRASFTRRAGAVDIRDGAVTAKKVYASKELWAKIAAFGSVTTDMLIAGKANITSDLIADAIYGKTIVGGVMSGGEVNLVDSSGTSTTKTIPTTSDSGWTGGTASSSGYTIKPATPNNTLGGFVGYIPRNATYTGKVLPITGAQMAVTATVTAAAQRWRLSVTFNETQFATVSAPATGTSTLTVRVPDGATIKSVRVANESGGSSLTVKSITVSVSTALSSGLRIYRDSTGLARIDIATAGGMATLTSRGLTYSEAGTISGTVDWRALVAPPRATVHWPPNAGSNAASTADGLLSVDNATTKDLRNGFTTTGGWLVAPLTGWYHVEAAVGFQWDTATWGWAVAAGIYRQRLGKIDWYNDPSMTLNLAPGIISRPVATGLIHLDAGEKVTLGFWQNTGSWRPNAGKQTLTLVYEYAD